MTRTRLPLALLLWLGPLGGCGGGASPNNREVGFACTVNADCSVKSTCLMTGEFGRGMCSHSCKLDSDCPSGAACMAADGGVCAATCNVASDCKGFGDGYVCEEKSTLAGGQAKVCRKP